MAPYVGILLIWTVVGVFLQVDHVNGGNSCVFPFTYGGEKYFDCTKKDSIYSWCSVTQEYSGKWKHCKNDDYAQCVFPFIYNGKSYDSCTTIGSFIEKRWCALSPDYDKDQAWKHCYK